MVTRQLAVNLVAFVRLDFTTGLTGTAWNIRTFCPISRSEQP